MLSANEQWQFMLSDIIKKGKTVKPRGMEVIELLGYTSKISMALPIVTNCDRNIGYKFMAAEAAWILSGDNRTSTITPFSREIGTFSDDGITYFGAYGPKIRDQLSYAAQCIAEDPDTRQAVINIWREKPGKTKDVPCTLSCQFLIRDDKLHIVDTMRSSDVWLGWPYDVFNFSMLARYMLIYLANSYGKYYGLGELYLTAGSQHLYTRNLSGAKKCLQCTDRDGYNLPEYGTMKDPDELVDWLWEAAKNDSLAVRS